MSSFVAHQTRILLRASSSSSNLIEKFGDATDTFATADTSSELPKPSKREEKLHALLLEFNPASKALPSVEKLKECISMLQESTQASARTVQTSALHTMDGEEALRAALMNRVVVGLYGSVMDTFLAEAREADDEAEWWANIERSKTELVSYMIQTFPLRLRSLVDTLRAHRIPLEFSSTTFERLFRPPTSLRPSLLIRSLYPHLQTHSRIILQSPLELTRDECRTRRKELIKIRDERAKNLGYMASLRDDLERALKSGDSGRELIQFCQIVDRHLSGGNGPLSQAAVVDVSILSTVLSTSLPSHTSMHTSTISVLRRPPRLVRIWPRLVLIPPITLLLFRVAYGNKDTIIATFYQAGDTVKGFFADWVIEPIRAILETVRTGGDEGARIISKESLKADLSSLERMSLSLTSEKMAYTPEQLHNLSTQIHNGDLTSVLKIYEDDIKSPLKSAVSGSLIRSLLIQVHKAKVDLDFALTGIDKLLRSQELTFGFVGVAPALAVLYFAGSWVRDTWKGGRGKGRYGGKKRREKVWLAMRRVERLLMRAESESTPPGLTGSQTGHARIASDDHLQAASRMSSPALVSNSSSRPSDSPTQSSPHGLTPLPITPGLLSPLTQGLLLLSLTQLRTFGEQYLPADSRLAEGWLEDVEDLEDPTVSRRTKIEVVGRMWRSWSRALGWDEMGRK